MDEFVVVVTLPGTAERFTRTCSGVVSLGRSEDCSIQLAHPLVSRHHAEVSQSGEGFRVKDLGSRNGTVVNGAAVHGELVAPGRDVTVQLGPYLLNFAAAGADDSTMMVMRQDPGARMSLDRSLHALTVDGSVALDRLSPLEFKLLDALFKDAPRAVANQRLGDAVWGTDMWDVYMLHNLVRRFRKKLEEQQLPAEELLITVPNVGYRVG